MSGHSRVRPKRFDVHVHQRRSPSDALYLWHAGSDEAVGHPLADVHPGLLHCLQQRMLPNLSAVDLASLACTSKAMLSWMSQVPNDIFCKAASQHLQRPAGLTKAELLRQLKKLTQMRRHIAQGTRKRAATLTNVPAGKLVAANEYVCAFRCSSAYGISQMMLLKLRPEVELKIACPIPTTYAFHAANCASASAKNLQNGQLSLSAICALQLPSRSCWPYQRPCAVSSRLNAACRPLPSMPL